MGEPSNCFWTVGDSTIFFWTIEGELNDKGGFEIFDTMSFLSIGGDVNGLSDTEIDGISLDRRIFFDALF